MYRLACDSFGIRCNCTLVQLKETVFRITLRCNSRHVKRFSDWYLAGGLYEVTILENDTALYTGNCFVEEYDGDYCYSELDDNYRFSDHFEIVMSLEMSYNFLASPVKPGVWKQEGF